MYCLESFVVGVHGHAKAAANGFSTAAKQIKESWLGRKVSHYSPKEDSVVRKTVGFVKTNWKVIAATALAWGIIIGLAGGLYGFQAVALKLVIGGAVGVGVGTTVGLVRALIIRPGQKHKNYSSAWGAVNTLYGKLDENGTKEFLVALVTTATLAIAIIYPYAAGGLIGAIILDHLINQIYYYKDETIPNLETRVDAIETRFGKIIFTNLAANLEEAKEEGEQYRGVKLYLLSKADKLKEELNQLASEVAALDKSEVPKQLKWGKEIPYADSDLQEDVLPYIQSLYQQFVDIKNQLGTIKGSKSTVATLVDDEKSD